jgi:hemolysin III
MAQAGGNSLASPSSSVAVLSPSSASPPSSSAAAVVPASPMAAAGSYLEKQREALHLAVSAMEMRFQARKAAFLADYEARKASLQASINSWTGKTPSDAPRRASDAAGFHVVVRGPQQRGGRGGPASVTYRSPMRDPEDSHQSSHVYTGPQSSGEMGSSAADEREEQSLTVGSWLSRDPKAYALELSAMRMGVHEAHYEDEERRMGAGLDEEMGADADVESVYAEAMASPVVEHSPEVAAIAHASADTRAEAAEAEERQLSTDACHVHAVGDHLATMVMHSERCVCESGATPTAAEAAACSVELKITDSARTSRSNSLTDSHSISLHIHSADASEPSSSNGATPSLDSPSLWLTSTLDTSFIVAPVSSELLHPDHWVDAAEPYPVGVVPQAPLRTCSCWLPLRSWSHLWSHHVQPRSQARNVRFEGFEYPRWRGEHYPNGEPKAVLRGVLHELGFIAVCVYSIFIFSACISPAGFIAAAVSVASQLMLYATSSQFHRRRWLLPIYNRIKRLDHSAIFTLCAGTATPSALLLIRDPENVGHVQIAGWALLGWAWFGMLVGVIDSLTKSLRGKVALFGLVWMGVAGASMVPFVYHLHLVMRATEFYAVIATWLLYLFAMLTYARGWFNRWPSVFGYHEVFHAISIPGGVAGCVFNYSICSRLT